MGAVLSEMIFDCKNPWREPFSDGRLGQSDAFRMSESGAAFPDLLLMFPGPRAEDP